MEKHKAVIQGVIYRKDYEFCTNFPLPRPRPSYERSRSEIKMSRLMDAITHMSQYMWEGVIDAPLLNIGEKLYIEDLDVEIIVSERIRHTNGSYIYKTEHQLDLVENEDSLRSKNETREKE